MAKMKKKLEQKGNVMTEQLDEFVDFVTELVEPKKRTELSLKRWHKTVLTGTKAKSSNKNVKNKTKTKSKNLTRAEASKMGLYNLPTKSIKYVDLLPLNELWLQYMVKHLETFLRKQDGSSAAPEVHDSNYDAFSKALVKCDFHGAQITVVASCNPSLVGQTGIVAMETRNTFKIVSIDNRIRTIPKPESIFKIVINGIEFKIFGKYLNIRPAERSVKKIKTLMDPDL